MVRLLIVDDSASVRAVLRRLFQAAPEIEVVGEAADGEQAVAAAARLTPDVIIMDLLMPVMDGLTAIDQIRARRPTPILVLSARANFRQMEAAFEAVRRGALEVLPKPEDPESWRQLAGELPRIVIEAAEVGRAARRASAAGGAAVAGAATRPAPGGSVSGVVGPLVRPLRWVAIGSSTGGPAALRELFEEIPAETPASFLVVQHIAPGFEQGLAEWLRRGLPLDIRVGEEGEAPSPGAVRLAPADAHLRLSAAGTIVLDRATPARRGHRPSADELFQSCVAQAARTVAGVLMTGMGSDGAEGLAELARAGALTMVQDEASCAVFGMPRAGLERGAAEVALPPRELGRALVRAWRGRP